MCCILRRGAERALNHGGDLIIIDRSRASSTGLIQELLDAVRQKAPTPFPDRVLMEAGAIRASEDNSATL